MSPLISIIIPVYNVENYLEYCVKSVLSQDYENLEIILIDDGSSDSSGRMCDEFAEKDKRIKVIHQGNGGLSFARNIGLKIMAGEYFSFIDSDDYVRSDYISGMYHLIEEDKSDMAICMNKKVAAEVDFASPAETAPHETYDNETLKLKMVSRKIPMYAHGKLYKKELAENMRFPEGRLFEDVLTSWNVIKEVSKASFTEEQLYFYRQRPESIVNVDFKHGRMDQVYFSKRIFEEIEDNTALKNAAGSRCFFAAADNYTLVTDEFTKEKEYLKKSIKMFRKYVLKDKTAEKSLKFMAFVSYISPSFVRTLGRAYKKKKQKNLATDK